MDMDELALKSVKDLSVKELKDLIETTVRETIEDEIEDQVALRSLSYLASIEDARTEFAEGSIKSFSDLFPDV